MIWKISTKEQVSQVLKRSYLTTSPTVAVLANGVNSNQTKAIFLVHSVNREKYPEIFNRTDSYISNYFDFNCKNEVKFRSYNDTMPIEENVDKSDLDPKELAEKEAENVAEFIRSSDQYFLDLIDERYMIVFWKVPL